MFSNINNTYSPCKNMKQNPKNIKFAAAYKATNIIRQESNKVQTINKIVPSFCYLHFT